MKKINTHEAKTYLSSYLRKLRRGERLIVCRRNVPIAELRALSPGEAVERRIGLAKGELEITASFFEPLPGELLAAFSAGDEAP